MTRRRMLVTAWLLASGVPLLLAVVLIGCCALPFHGQVHRLVPLCAMAEAALTGHHHGEHGGQEQPAAPPPQKQDGQDAPRLVLKSDGRGHGLAPLLSWPLQQLTREVVHRSQTAPGALRCDDDVGARLALLDTLRI